jgi:hypothetical protein
VPSVSLSTTCGTCKSDSTLLCHKGIQKQEQSLSTLPSSENVPPKCRQLDVLSVATTTRLHEASKQLRTLGSNPCVRHFEVVHEEHHEAYGQITCKTYASKLTNAWMRTQTIPVDAKGWRKYVAPDIGKHDMIRGRSDGWMCAQRRPIIGSTVFTGSGVPAAVTIPTSSWSLTMTHTITWTSLNTPWGRWRTCLCGPSHDEELAIWVLWDRCIVAKNQQDATRSWMPTYKAMLQELVKNPWRSYIVRERRVSRRHESSRVDSRNATPSASLLACQLVVLIVLRVVGWTNSRTIPSMSSIRLSTHDGRLYSQFDAGVLQRHSG